MLKTFRAFQRQPIELEEAKNTHLEHIEDLMFNEGVNGTRQAINFLRYTRDHLAGHSRKKVNISLKWDGAPAIFAGIDPSDGEFFVAKKGIFNKDAKVYKTYADVDADISSPDLSHKMKLALKHLPSIGIKGVIQGDFLFSSDTISRASIDGVDYITFHPNTIVYAVPIDTPLARKMLQASIGIVWHTTYTGTSFENMKANFNQPIVDKLRENRHVWFTDSIMRDVSGYATMTIDETRELSSLFSQAGKLFNQIPADVLNRPSQDSELLIRIKTFNNSKIRQGQPIRSASRHVDQMVDWIVDYYQKKIDKLKGEAAKQRWLDERNRILSYFSDNNKNDIVRVFELMQVLREAKKLILDKLNEIKRLNTFLLTKEGFKVTGHEGFVVSDHLGRSGVKLVDRLQFSFANFSPEVLKGFDIKTR